MKNIYILLLLLSTLSCTNNQTNIESVIVSDSETKKYISETGKIDSGKRNGLTAKCQRSLTSAVKRARHMALLPFSSNHVYDTSLLSIGKESLNDESEEINSAVEDSKPETEILDEAEESSSEILDNNEEISSESVESNEQDSDDKDTEKND